MKEYPSIEDFVIKKNIVVLNKDDETEINQYMENYFESVNRNEAIAIIESYKIILNC